MPFYPLRLVVQGNTEDTTGSNYNGFQVPTQIYCTCRSEDALDSNIRGIDGKRRILSVIADTFSYENDKRNLSEVFRWTNLQHTVPQTPWINKSGIFPNRLNMDQLKFDNRRELVSLLEDVVSQKIENTENQILSTDMLDSNEEIRLGTKGKSKSWKKGK
ncbi:172_t:CDS:2 [Rhizophagus irregularis]|nr:172_t:CDS:2 [Rhizophagus irregularis]